jgi:hypothetical protein
MTLDQAREDGPALQVDHLHVPALGSYAVADLGEAAVPDHDLGDDPVARVHRPDLAVHELQALRVLRGRRGPRGLRTKLRDADPATQADGRPGGDTAGDELLARETFPPGRAFVSHDAASS